MGAKHISQREARLLRKRVAELEARERRRRQTWSQEWFGGVQIASATWTEDVSTPVAIRTAINLSHAVVCTSDNDATVRFIALPHYEDAI